MRLPYHPQLMHIIPHNHPPMLRGIGELADPFLNAPSDHRLLGEPFPRRAGDGMPAQFDRARLSIDVCFGFWDLVRFVAETDGVLEVVLGFDCFLFGAVQTFLPVVELRFLSTNNKIAEDALHE